MVQITMKKGIVTLMMGLMLSWGTTAAARDEEKPFSDTEVNKWITDYPELLQWSRKNQNISNPSNQPWIIAGMRHNKGFIDQLTAKGWTADRFFYTLDHLQQGLRIHNARKDQIQAQQRMKQSRQQFQNAASEMAQRAAASQKEMEAATKEQQAWARKQLEDQERRIRQDPTMNPWQKQQSLEFLRQQRAWIQQSSAPATAQNGQQQFQQAQRQSIINNPYIPEGQKRWILQQMQSNPGTQPQAVMNPEQARDAMIKQQKMWIAQQKAQLANNPYIPYEQRQIMERQMQQYVRNMEEGARQSYRIPSILPGGEMELIGKYSDKLQKIFQ
ncbi:MAG: hypothetical protein HQL79_04735 [Magnetococcales bacterium]|nr:hypothetical protein [Magnetococcales bacterium]